MEIQFLHGPSKKTSADCNILADHAFTMDSQFCKIFINAASETWLGELGILVGYWHRLTRPKC